MSTAEETIVLSDDGEYVEIDSDDDASGGLGEGWTCVHCTTSNSAIAGDCSVCGLPKAAEINAAAVEAIVDLTEATEAYVRATNLSEETITLDKCGCILDRRKVRDHIISRAAAMPENCDGLDGHFNCYSSNCSNDLTRRDIVSMLDAKTCQAVDAHIFAVFERHLSASPQPKQKKARTLSTAGATQAHDLAKAIVALQDSLGVKRKAAEAKGGDSASSSEVNTASITTRRSKLAAEKEVGEKAKAAVAPAKKAPAAKGKNKGKGIAKGTGYGGDTGYIPYVDSDSYRGKKSKSPKMDNMHVLKAQEKEDKADQGTLKALQDIKECIDTAQGSSARLLQGCCMLTSGVAYGSPLAFLLRRLLQNDSLMDIGRRSDLYWGVVRLIQSLGRCVDFIPLFLKPAVDPNDADEGADAESMLDALRTLDVQCRVFKRNAEDLESEEEIRALSLALEINSHFEDLQKAADVLRSLDDAPGPSQRRSSDGGGAESNEREEDKTAALEKRYCEAVSKFKLEQWPLLALRDFYFRDETRNGQAFAGRKSMLRIGQEMSSLSTSLPAAWATSVFLVSDENRMDVMRACIIGPEGTPYDNGVFLFDILLPPQYPEVPPKVQFLTTGGGKFRFNPNLYACGKVCLSLLGTWQGPGWQPGSSTLLQVMVSIQSMIFIEDPYFNEPGYENAAGTAAGNNQSEAYNRKIRQGTLAHALLPALEKPPPAFKDVLQVHFKFKHEAIAAQLQRWLELDPAIMGTVARTREALKQYALN